MIQFESKEVKFLATISHKISRRSFFPVSVVNGFIPPKNLLSSFKCGNSVY